MPAHLKMKRAILFVFAIIFINSVLAEGSFNLEVELPENYQSVLAGEDIEFTTKLNNFAGVDRIDVVLKYEIFDSERILKSSKTETVAIETQASFIGSLPLIILSNLSRRSFKNLYRLRVPNTTET